MYKTEVPSQCSRSQPGVKGQFKRPCLGGGGGAFVISTNFSCLKQSFRQASYLSQFRNIRGLERDI